MSKTTITLLFWVAVATVAAGVVIGIVSVVTALADGAIVIGGPQLITVNPGPTAWAIAGLVVASLVIGAGNFAAIVSWLGALRNTYQLDDRTWFGVLAVLGVVSLGWIAMFAYVFAGPDGATPAKAHRGEAS